MAGRRHEKSSMKAGILACLLPGFALLPMPVLAPAIVSCGTEYGRPAIPTPIKVGGIHGNPAPGDSFVGDRCSSVFRVRERKRRGYGRPIQYIIENDRWNGELAAQGASKLVQDMGIIAVVRNGSFVKMRANRLLKNRHLRPVWRVRPDRSDY